MAEVLRAPGCLTASSGWPHGEEYETIKKEVY